ncbi:MAG: RNA polymerase subunit sigma [Bacteroidetes bacterium 4484_276]|nr:MAG: RNA polymerase subunit sigma [Bacteroidetes bacterium 4484_276]
MQNQDNKLELAANYIKDSKYLVAFTGAGISVESGIPPFRGAEGLWSKYDPQVLDLGYFHQNPLESWEVIKEIFYDFFGNAKPNPAHIALAQLEKMGILKCVITQNIDNLHQAAGNTIVHEFHGNSQKLVCTSCSRHYKVKDLNLDVLPPLCESCNSLIKPDFIFFGEGIPPGAHNASVKAAEAADVFIIIGSTGEIMPASQIPVVAKQSGAKIIEVNPESSRYTDYVTDIHLQGKAGKVMVELLEKIAELE